MKFFERFLVLASEATSESESNLAVVTGRVRKLNKGKIEKVQRKIFEVLKGKYKQKSTKN